MRIKTLLLIVLILVVLTACGRSGEDLAAELAENTPIEVEETLPADTPTVAVQEEGSIQPMVEKTSESAELPVLEVSLVSECTLVSSQPDPPQEYAEIFAVSEDDWVIGPEDAAITLIEYGDFQ